MTVAVLALCLVVALAVVAALPRRRNDLATVGSVLRWIALGLTMVISAFLLPGAIDDGWEFALALVGIPLVAMLLSMLSYLAGVAVRPITVLAAVVMLAWGLLLGLGPGLYFVLPAIVLWTAAAFSARPVDLDPNRW